MYDLMSGIYLSIIDCNKDRQAAHKTHAKSYITTLLTLMKQQSVTPEEANLYTHLEVMF